MTTPPHTTATQAAQWRLAGPLTASLLCLALAAAASAAGAPEADAVREVGITRDLGSITVQHDGEAVTIERNQDQTNRIDADFQRTSRRCPPFCIQPMRIADGVDTIGEIELLDFLRRAAAGDPTILVIDSRGPDWVAKGTIPGSVNIHYTKLSPRAAGTADIAAILEDRFGARRDGELWDFRFAKTLVLFCNGPWCGQSPTNIRSLMRLGYPPSKLKWYRGGMQSWENLGLTTVAPD